MTLLEFRGFFLEKIEKASHDNGLKIHKKIQSILDVDGEEASPARAMKAPHEITGSYKNSFKHRERIEGSERFIQEVFTTKPYAARLEFGGDGVAPHPHMRPAVYQTMKEGAFV